MAIQEKEDTSSSMIDDGSKTGLELVARVTYEMLTMPCNYSLNPEQIEAYKAH